MNNQAPSIVSLADPKIDLYGTLPTDKEHLINKGMDCVVTPDEINTIKQNMVFDHVDLGGSAFNTLRGLSKLGMASTLLGVAPDDDHGVLAKQKDELRIDLSHLKKTPYAGKGGIIIIIDPQTGERSFVSCDGESSDPLINYQLTDQDKEMIKNADILFLDGYDWYLPSKRKAHFEAAELVNKDKTKVLFTLADPAIPTQYKEDVLRFIKTGADIVFGNEIEYQTLFNTNDINEIFDHLKQIPQTMFVLTLGKDGACTLYNGEHTCIPSKQVSPDDFVNTNGAGDMFATGFIHCFLNRYADINDMFEKLCLSTECGHAAAAMAVCDQSTVPDALKSLALNSKAA